MPLMKLYEKYGTLEKAIEAARTKRGGPRPWTVEKRVGLFLDVELLRADERLLTVRGALLKIVKQSRGRLKLRTLQRVYAGTLEDIAPRFASYSPQSRASILADRRASRVPNGVPKRRFS